MPSLKSLTGIFLLLAAPVLSLPTMLEARDCTTTCGSNCYSSDQVNAALAAGCSYYQDGTTAGGSKYPENYNDYEGFSFGGVSEPYLEFPILESGVYSGGKLFYVLLFPFKKKFRREKYNGKQENSLMHILCDRLARRRSYCFQYKL
jgi:hypothetical protein